MKRLKNFCLIALIFCISLFSNHTNAQQVASGNKSLNEKEKSIIIISSLTAKGDLAKLKTGA